MALEFASQKDTECLIHFHLQRTTSMTTIYIYTVNRCLISIQKMQAYTNTIKYGTMWFKGSYNILYRFLKYIGKEIFSTSHDLTDDIL